MEEFGAIFISVNLAGLLVIAVILLGPSLHSSYENWKIREGLKGENPMSKIREIKDAVETNLDQLEARATAVETLLQQTNGQAVERYEALKKGLGDTLNEFESELAKARVITNENMQEVRSRFDHLRVQLALGKAEERDSFEAQKKSIHHSINALEATVGEELGVTGQAIQEPLRKAANKFIAAGIKLEAEMEFLAIQFEVKKDASWDGFTYEKRALILQINRYKDQLEEERRSFA